MERPYPGVLEPSRAARVLSLIHEHLGHDELAGTFAALAIELGGRLAGRWQFEERATVSIYRSPDGLWAGTTVASTRASEIGRWALRGVKADAAEATWRGEVLTSEAGRADVILRLIDAMTLELVATKGDFAKVMRWARVV